MEMAGASRRTRLARDATGSTRCSQLSSTMSKRRSLSVSMIASPIELPRRT